LVHKRVNVSYCLVIQFDFLASVVCASNCIPPNTFVIEHVKA